MSQFSVAGQNAWPIFDLFFYMALCSWKQGVEFISWNIVWEGL